MFITLICAAILMAGLFLMLLAAVAFIQDKRLFGSAPKDIQAVVQPRNERFPGARIIGWGIMVFALLLFPAAIVLGAWDGIRKGYALMQFFIRFLAMLLLLKAFDICFIDWVLLCHSDFFPRFYPETKGHVGSHQFGFNKRTHILHSLLFVPIAAGIAWVCALF